MDGKIYAIFNVHVERYLSIADKWQVIKSYNMQRYRMGIAVFNDCLLAIGGSDGNISGTYKKDVEVYNRKFKSWEKEDEYALFTERYIPVTVVL